MEVGGTEATYVRFGRAGWLHSPRIDLLKGSDGSTRAFASLPMFDRADQGYDPAFVLSGTTGRLMYCIDLPKSTFEYSKFAESAEVAGSDGRLGSEAKKLRRAEVCGRATIVSRARVRTLRDSGDEELDNGNPNYGYSRNGSPPNSRARTRSLSKVGAKRKRSLDEIECSEPVLKIIRRDLTREPEDEVMEELYGGSGVVQYVWHSDVMGRCHCLSPTGKCHVGTCMDGRVQVDKFQACNNLWDIDDADGNLGADTTQCDPVMHRRTRVCSYILTSSAGMPLGAAPDPGAFMNAVLDAIMCYWQLVNLGIPYHDINYNNVVLLNRNEDFDRNRWEGPYAREPMREIFAASERSLEELLVKLNRNPSGMLLDFDHVSQLEEAESRIGFQARIPAFMSVRVLRVIDQIGQEHPHNFLDDLESFFWVILWSTATHLDGTTGSQPTGAAQVALNSMDQTSMQGLRTWKYAILCECSGLSGQEMKNMLAEFGNTWASHPVFVNTLVSLGDYFRRIYWNGGVPSADSLPLVFSEIVDIIRSALPATSDA